LGGAKDFSPNFLKLAQKVVVQLLPTVFVVWPPKNCLHLFFCKPWAPFFEVKQRWVPFLPRFSGILPRYLGILFGSSGILPKFSRIFPDFQQIKIFGDVLTPPEPPPPTPLPKRHCRCNHTRVLLCRIFCANHATSTAVGPWGIG